MSAPPPFMDVTVDGDTVDLPRLKLRELLFIGALRREGGLLVRDASRPLPPFRLPGLFPAGARFSPEDHGDRVRLRRLPSGTVGAVETAGVLEEELARRAEAVLPPPGEGEIVVSPWAPPPASPAVIVRFEHVYGGAPGTPVPDGGIVCADDGETRFALAAPGSAAADALRRAGFELLYARVVMRAPAPSSS